MDILGNPENGDVHGNLIDSDIHGHAPGMDVHGSEPHDVFGHYDPQAGSSFDGGGIGEVLGDLFGFLLGG